MERYTGNEFYIISIHNQASGRHSERGLRNIDNKDFKNLRSEYRKQNTECRLQLDEYDPFKKMKHQQTKEFEIIKKDKSHNSFTLRARIVKMGNATYMSFLASSVECINNTSSVELLLENDKTLKFYHKYDVDCGSNICITGNLSTTKIQYLKNHRIIAAKVNGAKYYANFLTPMESSLYNINSNLKCLKL